MPLKDFSFILLLFNKTSSKIYIKSNKQIKRDWNYVINVQDSDRSLKKFYHIQSKQNHKWLIIMIVNILTVLGNEFKLLLIMRQRENDIFILIIDELVFHQGRFQIWYCFWYFVFSFCCKNVITLLPLTESNLSTFCLLKLRITNTLSSRAKVNLHTLSQSIYWIPSSWNKSIIYDNDLNECTYSNGRFVSLTISNNYKLSVLK